MTNDSKVTSKIWINTRVLLTAVAIVAVWSVRSVTFAQEHNEGKTSPEQEDTKMSMSCPMMAGLKGIELAADAPPLLIARAEELKLTDDQQKQLAAIAKEAREKAQAVLTANQKNMLGDSTEPMSMMEVAMMRAKKMDHEGSNAMCPMCMKMMQKKMSDKKEKTKGEHRTSDR